MHPPYTLQSAEETADLSISLNLGMLPGMPSFVTDLTMRLFGLEEERVCIPISDDCARMPYWCCCQREDEKKYLRWFQMLERLSSQRERL